MLINIKPHVIFQELEGELVLLNMETEQYYGLDEMGGKIWNLLDETHDAAIVSKTIYKLYDVSEEQANKDVFELINKLKGADLIELVDDV
jgi:hypothetical protein